MSQESLMHKNENFSLQLQREPQNFNEGGRVITRLSTNPSLLEKKSLDCSDGA